ncbi:MAG TPA: AI-2E family transporter [Hyphomicrobium sp.]|nr:AI-2E family transporter [Hyphomicrobium sp.]
MPLLSESFRSLASALTVAALLIAALVLGKEILIPITLAAVLTFILSPIVRGLAQWRMPRALAVTLVMLGVLATVIGFTTIVSTQLITLTADMESYRYNILEKVRAVTGRGDGKSDITRAAEAVDSIGTAIQKEMQPSKATEPIKTDGSAVPAQPTNTTVIVTKPPEASSNALLSILTQVGGPIGQAALTFLLTAFLLAQYQDLRDRVVRVVGTDHMTDTTAAMSEAGERLSQLFLMQALLNASFGFAVGLLLWMIGLPNAVLWGLLCAVMRFVPYIGSILAAVPPILLAAAIDPGWTMVFSTAAVFAIGEPMMGHIVEPFVLGKRAGIYPFAMVASAAFWTLLWGPIGLILAAPLTMTLIVMGRYVKNLEFFSVLLGDEPALSPPHELYHRLLSDDAVSAAQHVDGLLASSSLAEVTDRLIFPALGLAAQDYRSGRLDKEQIAELSETSGELLELLAEDRQDIDAPADADGTGRNVMIVPVRGAIDAIAARYLAHILHIAGSNDDISISASSGLTALADARAMPTSERPDFVILATVSGMDPQQMRFIVKRAIRDYAKDRVAIIDFRSADDAHFVSSESDWSEGVAYSRAPSAVITMSKFGGTAAVAKREVDAAVIQPPYAIPA